jgi:NAD(P)H dehydrogenase (quinone)
MYGHVFQIAKKVAQGVRKAGGDSVLKQIGELIPRNQWSDGERKAREAMMEIPIADPRKDLKGIDGVLVGTPTRFGNMCAQMRNFRDQTSDDWVKGSLIGKPAAVFISTATQHGGQETTIISTMITLLHHGCVLVGLPYSFQEQTTLKEISGGSPYGASTIAGPTGKRVPSANELTMALGLGKHLTIIAKKLAA